MTTHSAFASVLLVGSSPLSVGTAGVHEALGDVARIQRAVVNHPGGCIAVYQEKGGSVRFEMFLVDPLTKRLVPIRAYRVSVVIPGKRTPVWQAEAEDYSSAHQITYGVVPDGFNERIPAEQLIPGVRYRVIVRSSSAGGIQRVFLHEASEKKGICPWDGSPQN